MGLFNKKKKSEPENIEKLQQISEKTYAQWKQEYNSLEVENLEMEEQCAQNGDSWQEMLLKTKDIKGRMAYADKMMRKLQEPSLTYNKKWKGMKMLLDDFIDKATGKEIVDSDGYGYYATETAKTDIIIRPSDITEDIYRTDFPYVIWFTE